MASNSHSLEAILLELHASLPYSPQWVGVITVDATSMGFHGLDIEEDRATGLLAAAEAIHSRISSELGTGNFRYTVIGAEHGVLIVISLAEIGVLGLKFQQIKSFDGLFSSLPKVLSPLLRHLGIESGN